MSIKIKVTPEFQKAYQMLNKEQKEAVDSIEGPVMVIAGPGTGKTQILTLRIANILKKTDAPPDAVLALTFTESAAANMKKRLVSLIGPEGYKVRVHTFHGFANSVIQEYPDAFARFIDSSALSDVEKVLIIARILDEGNFKELYPFGEPHKYVVDIAGAISSLKRDAIGPEQFKEFVQESLQNFEANDDLINPKTGKIKQKYITQKNKLNRSLELAEIYELYEETLAREKKYDFEDMILELVRKMKEDEEFKLQVQEEFLYVLADEHQDANDAQNALLELLTDFHETPNLFIVGDEKQAIYRFQGASLENFLYFQNKFKNVKTIVLKNAYRSAQKILDTSFDLMSQDFSLKRERLLSKAAQQNAELHLYAFSSDENEAYFVASKIKELANEGVPLAEIAILYRTNKDAELFAKELAKQGVPFSIESDTDALKDKEIAKFLTLLYAIKHFGSDEHLVKALHLAFLDIDELDLYKVVKYSRTSGRSVHEILDKKQNLQSLELNDPGKLFSTYRKIKRYAKLTKQEPLQEIINLAMEEFSFLAYALNSSNPQDTLAKLSALLKDAQSMAQGSLNYHLDDFLEHLEILQKHGLAINKASTQANTNTVKLMTAHKAKGLEFENVFIVRAFDSKWGNRRRQDKFILPTKSADKDEENADERRLFFVAMTRAKHGLFITYAQKSESGKVRLPSMIVDEIEKHLNLQDTTDFESKVNPVEILKPAPKAVDSLADKDYLRGLFVEQGLSVTALNNFLECPWKFFYSNLIRIPKMQTKYMILGNAVHLALKLAHDAANKNKKIDEQELLDVMREYIKKRALSQKVFDESFALAKEYLLAWLSEHKSSIGMHKTLNEYELVVELPLELEELSKIKLTGKLDKIELLPDGTVRVTDYKTGAPKSRNAILGKTKDSNGELYRQLVFYKLLLDLDGRYKFSSAVLDFVQPKKPSGKLVQEHFEIPDEDVEALKQEVQQAAQEIYNLSFWDSRCEKHTAGKCEYCALRDMMR